MRKNLKKSRDRILKIQDKKFRKLLRFAYDNSPYYKKVFDERGISKKQLKKIAIADLPVLDKKTLLEHFDSIVTVREVFQNEIRAFDENSDNKGKLFKKKFHVVHSSGSTGKPGYFLYDEKAWTKMLCGGVLRSALWGLPFSRIVKILKNHPKILLVAATDGRYGGAMAASDGISKVGAEQLTLDIKMPLEVWEEKLNKFKPDMVLGYPSALKILGRLMEEKRIEINPFIVGSCSEPLLKNQRLYLEKIFGCEIINYYGASESLALGVEANSRDGMLFFDDMNIIEEASDGIYVTCLYNFAMPLIRYKISDRLKIESPDGKDKIQFKKSAVIEGRTEDLMWFCDDNGNEKFLHPLSIEGICIEGLLDYQFKKTGKASFEILVEALDFDDDVKREEIKLKLKKFVDELLEEIEMNFVNFKIVFVKEINANPETGKKQLIVA